jgi:hypothetical protein
MSIGGRLAGERQQATSLRIEFKKLVAMGDFAEGFGAAGPGG